jgi:hypothetical protein
MIRIFVICLLFIPLRVSALELVDVSQRKIRPWSITFFLAGNLSGPAGQIEDTMIQTGFGASRPPTFLGPGKAFPETVATDASFMAGVTRYIRGPYTAGLYASSTHLGTTSGYHARAGGIRLENEVITVAALFSVNSYDQFRFGVGPAVYFLTAKQTGGTTSRAPDVEYTRVGFVVNLGLRYPSESLVFGELILEYRQVGSATIGPYTAEDSGNTAVLPEMDVTFNHFFIGLGFGGRF